MSRRRSMFSGIGLLVFATTVVAVGDTQVQFFDSQGHLLTDQTVGVTAKRADGGTVKLHLAPQADGTYSLPLGPGDDVHFTLHPQSPSLTSTAVSLKIPQGTVGPIPVEVPPAVPANDQCQAPQPILIGTINGGTTIGATPDAVPYCGTSNTAPGVWYSLLGNGTMLTASTCENLPGGGWADYDTKISVFCHDCSVQGCVAGNDDVTGCNFHSAASWCAQNGIPYLILVHGFNVSVGNFGLAVTTNGANCSPTIACSLVETGACCIQAGPPFEEGVIAVECVEVDHNDCLSRGGSYQGDSTGCFEPAGSFAYSNLTRVAIPSNVPAGVNSTITVPESFTIADVNVGISITHTWVNDLIVSITSPSGPTRVLWNQVCGSTDNIRATADDEGTETFCAPINAGPINAVFFPPALAGNGPLSIFDTQNASGVWTLNVADLFASDVGTLDEWHLTFATVQGICPAFECNGGGNDDDDTPSCLDCPVEPDGQVTICHRPPGNPANAHTIRISAAALAAHCGNHGDFCGPCSGDQPQRHFDLTPEGRPSGDGPVIVGQASGVSTERGDRGADRPGGARGR